MKDLTGLTDEQWNKRFPDFTKAELACRCCGLLNINLLFLDKIQQDRTVAGIPFSINSGCRCEKHNTKEGGKLKSKHLTSVKKQCEGLDISCISDRDRFIILISLSANIHHIGIANSFVHADNSKKTAVWLY